MANNARTQRISEDLLLQIPMVIPHCPQLDSIRILNSEYRRIKIPLEADITTELARCLRRPKRKLSVSQAVPFEENDIRTIWKPLNAGQQVSRWPPAQTALQTVDGLAHAIENSFSAVYPNDSSGRSFEAVNGNERTVAPPADGGAATIQGAQGALVDLLWYRGVSEGFGALAPELGLFLPPSHGDVFRQLEVVWRHSHLGDGIETSAHEQYAASLDVDRQDLFVWRPPGCLDASIDSAHNFYVGRVGSRHILLANDDNIATGKDKARSEAAAEVMEAHYSVYCQVGIRALDIP